MASESIKKLAKAFIAKKNSSQASTKKAVPRVQDEKTGKWHKSGRVADKIRAQNKKDYDYASSKAKEMYSKNPKLLETSKVKETKAIESGKSKPSVKSAGRPSKDIAPSPGGKKGAKKSLGAYADEILKKGKSSSVPADMPASPAHGPKLSAGGRAMRVAATEVAGEGEKTALKKIAGKTAGKIGKTFGKLAGIGALGGAVGLGVNALVEGLDATEANAGEDEQVSKALAKAKKEPSMKAPKPKGDKQVKKEFGEQIRKNFYPGKSLSDIPLKKPAARAGVRIKADKNKY